MVNIEVQVFRKFCSGYVAVSEIVEEATDVEVERLVELNNEFAKLRNRTKCLKEQEKDILDSIQKRLTPFKKRK